MARQSLAEIITEYERQFESNPLTTDRSLLETGKKILQKQLESTSLEPEVVHLGLTLYDHLGDNESGVNLLSRYLTQSLSTDERAWAWWELVDHFVLLRRYEEAVKAHKEFLNWAYEALPRTRLFWVMHDTSWAFCWLAIGEGDEWFQIFNDLMASVDFTPENRADRFQILRSAGHVLAKLGRFDEVLQMASKIRSLADEDPSWERTFSHDIRIESYAFELNVYQMSQNMTELRRVGIATTELLEEYFHGLPQMTSYQKKRLRMVYHNTAAPLYRARQYDLAILLFQRAIELGITSPHTYGWLAACLWATNREKNRSEVLALLKQAAHRTPGQYRCHKLPEFQDVVDDVEFQRAATVKQSNS